MRQVSEQVFRWICKNGYYTDHYIPDLVLSNYQLYSISVAPDYVTVWLWLWANSFFIDVTSTWTTNDKGNVEPIAIATYRSNDLFFRGTGQTVPDALEAVITEISSCYMLQNAMQHNN